MSGSRRHRMLNLNAPVEPTRVPGVGVRQAQPSHPQMPMPMGSSAVAPYPQTATNTMSSGVARPMVIQYGNPNSNPGQIQIGHPHQTRQIFPTQIPTLANPPPSTSPPIKRGIPTNDFVTDRLVAAITPILTSHQEDTIGEVKKVEGFVEKLSADYKETKGDTQKQLLQLTDAMQKAFLLQQTSAKSLNTRMEKIEKLIFAGFDRNDEGSLLSRIENIQYSMGELAERAKDPGAYDLAIASRQANSAPIIIDIEPTSTPEPALEPHMSRLQPEYADQSTSCEILKPLPARSPSPARPVYANTANDTVDLEPEWPPAIIPATEVIRPDYVSVANGPRTPSHPQLQRINTEVFSSSTPVRTPPRMSSAEFRQLSSASKLGNGSRDDLQNSPNLEDVGMSPRLKRMQSRTASGLEGEDIDVVEADDSMDVDHLVLSPVVASSPALNEMSADDEAIEDDDEEMIDELEDDDIQIGTPTRHSLPPNFELSPEVETIEENVASVRRKTAANSSSPAPQQATQLSSLPSPATTPSAPCSPERDLSSLLPVVPVATPRRQKKPLVVVSSPSSRSGSSPVNNDLLPTPIDEPSAAPAGRAPSRDPPANSDVVPGSDDDSELFVSHMITQQIYEEPLMSPEVPDPEPDPEPVVQTGGLRPTSLFLPASRSRSPPPLGFDDAPPYESPPPVPFPESPPPSPKITQSPSKPTRPTTPVVKAKAKAKSNTPITIFSPDNSQILRRGNSSLSIKQPPTKSPTITRSSSLRPNARPAPPPKPISVNSSSPIYISSRSPSPLSDLSPVESDSDSGSDIVRIVRKKKTQRDTKVKRESIATTSAGSASASTSIKRIDLSKLKAKKGESAAITRVKKRKASALEMEPPLKRARQKADEGDAVRVKREKKSISVPNGKGKSREDDDHDYRVKNKAKSGSTSKEKKLRPRAPPPGCKWPKKNMSGDKKFDHQFIECEQCFTWYHYGCIGITDLEDPIIKHEARFVCPPCKGGGDIFTDPLVASDSIVCGRPDCGHEEKQEDEFFMTAIVGRHTKVEGGTGRKYMWLVKWDGYPINECTWEAEDGMSDPQSFIDDFNANALKEGKDPDEDPHSTILLRVAIAGGWKDPNA
ncbi:hypothetical protein DXG01_000333 [Tephrocybe rancida]|nr:hypothetical protein DXG01_000333 [Tephrocybe rancida]